MLQSFQAWNRKMCLVGLRKECWWAALALLFFPRAHQWHPTGVYWMSSDVFVAQSHLAAQWRAFKALHCFTKISLLTVSLVWCAVLSACCNSCLAARMLLLIQGAEQHSVTDVVLIGAWTSRSCCIESLYFSTSSSSRQSASTMLQIAFTSDWNFSGLICRMFWEVTECFFPRGLDRLRKKKSDLWFSDMDTSWMGAQSSAVTSQRVDHACELARQRSGQSCAQRARKRVCGHQGWFVYQSGDWNPQWWQFCSSL